MCGGQAWTDIRVFVSACLLKQAMSLWDSPLSSVVLSETQLPFFLPALRQDMFRASSAFLP